MCTNSPNTPTTSRRLVDRPVISRQFLRGLGSSAGRQTGTPGPPRRAGSASNATPGPSRRGDSSSAGTQGVETSGSLPGMANLLTLNAPFLFGVPFPPTQVGGGLPATANNTFPTSVFPSAPVEAGQATQTPVRPQPIMHFGNFSDPRSPLDPENVKLFPPGESSSSPGHSVPRGTLGSAFSPRTRERIITGKSTLLSPLYHSFSYTLL